MEYTCTFEVTFGENGMTVLCGQPAATVWISKTINAPVVGARCKAHIAARVE